MKLNFLLAALLVFGLTGCAAPKTWQATDGSRADAVVELSYEYMVWELPDVDDAQGMQVALARCKSWGYTSAEAFGGDTKEAIDSSSYRVTKKYQCRGRGTVGK
ncbi:MAG: YecR-like lipofamily protein [Deltaproteobacteria bacterium]|jgi:hypothetical protein|nr:YecR-like lipofamily protein [Deltaproteobacteria bacterium]